MSKFNSGDMVTRGGWAQPREVKDGRRDSDGDIKVWNQDHTDWSYVDENLVSLVASTSAAPVVGAQSQSNTEGTTTMPKQTRRIVNVALIDEDAGLDVSKSLVKDFGKHVTEDSDAILIQEIIMENELASVLRAHNGMRGKEINRDIKNRTGNEVKLDEVKLKDLTWKITAA